MPRKLQEQILDHAEQEYPRECCGLLVGRSDPSRLDYEISRIVQSENRAPADRHDRFEIDPTLHLRLQRELRDSEQSVIGHYHSHPDGNSSPSETDRRMAWQPDMVWLIAAVMDGNAQRINGYMLKSETRKFTELAIEIV